ncbi:MAG: AI-2E family transporter [Bacteroidales bacterium]|jgi:predicted PurR-regulated permease PerM|nr:AI-2E family transporter [Bacteroidales bacterium]
MKFVSTHNNDVIRQVLFIIALIALGVVIFKELRFFLGGALGALTFYVILRNPFLFLVEKRKWNKSIASLALILLLVIFLMLFGAGAIDMVMSRISEFDNKRVMDGINVINDKIKQATGFDIYSSKFFEQTKDTLLRITSEVLNSAYGFAANMVMMIFILYFMLVNNTKMETNAVKIIPFRGKALSQVLQEVKGMIISNAVGIPSIMIIQGMIATLGYWIFGIKDPWFWGVITGFFSIIPIVGTVAVWGLLCIYLLGSGQIWQGIGLLLYCAVLVSSMDNIVRIVLGKYMVNTHPLITILGVIMGISLFGFWGIIFGPILIDLFLLLFKIYRTEYMHENERPSDSSKAVVS